MLYAGFLYLQRVGATLVVCALLTVAASRCRTGALGSWASAAVVPRLIYHTARGIKPMSSIPAGRFLTTGNRRPPGKSPDRFLEAMSRLFNYA